MTLTNERSQYLADNALGDTTDDMDNRNPLDTDLTESKLALQGSVPSRLLPHFDKGPQKYWCGNKPCRREMESIGIPKDWIIIKQSLGDQAVLKTVTIICSMECQLMHLAMAIANKARGAFV